MTDPLETIRQLYFKTTAATIEQDFDRAVDLLKTMPTEAARQRATVYMQGLAEMKLEWVTGRTKNKEQRTKNGTKNEEQRTKNERRTQNGERRTKNRERRTRNGG